MDRLNHKFEPLYDRPFFLTEYQGVFIAPIWGYHPDLREKCADIIPKIAEIAFRIF